MAGELMRHDDVVDDYHGTKVADPYRWLEDTDSPETRAWIEAQNALTFGWLGAIPERPRIVQRLTELWSYARYGIPFKEGGRYFWFENSGLQNQSVLYTQQGRAGKVRVLLDPNTLSADGTVALTSTVPSRNGRLLAYGVAQSGSDWNEIRVRDVASGRDLRDTLRWVKFSGISWTRDNRGFFYSRYDEPVAGNALQSVNRFHKIYYHRVGTRQSADELVYDRADQPDWLFNGQVSDDGQYLIIQVSQGTDSRNRLYFKDLGSPGRPRVNEPVVRLIDKLEASYDFVGNNGTEFVLRTNKDAPRGRLIAIDINNPREESWRTLIAESDDLLQSADFVGDRLVARYLQDARASIRFYVPPAAALREAGRLQRSGRTRQPGIGTTIERRAGSYRLVRELELPGPGMVSFSGDRGDREMFYSFTSYLYPTTVFRYDIRSGVSEVFRSARVDFDPSQYETKQVFYQSKDGTRVPMFITARKGITEQHAMIEMRRRTTLIGAMLLRKGVVDGQICGTWGTTPLHLHYIDQAIGLREGAKTYACMNGLILPNRQVMLVDTHVNYDPTAEQIAEIAVMAAEEMMRFGLHPKAALLSHSNFGTSNQPSAVKMREALAILQRTAPWLEVDGEMHGDAALDGVYRKKLMPTSTLEGDANLLVLPNLDAANIAYNLLKTAAGGGIAIGPLLLGAAKPVHILTPSATVRRIINMTAVTVADANAAR